jgi:hypothetical protein
VAAVPNASLVRLVADLKGFSRRKEVLRALRRRLREPLPGVQRAITASAMDTLPKRGGLAAWVAAEKITASLRLSGRAARVRLQGKRQSTRAQSDLAAIDAGEVRHPSWGRRGRGQWRAQGVTPEYFTRPATEVDQWRRAALDAVDDALEVIARG